MKALVRWATGERLTNRLPKLSLITLSPPLNSGILGKLSLITKGRGSRTDTAVVDECRNEMVDRVVRYRFDYNKNDDWNLSCYSLRVLAALFCFR